MRTSSSRPTAAGTARPARPKAVLAAAGAVLLSLAATGCGTDHGGTSAAPASDSKSVTRQPSSTGTAAGTTAPGATASSSPSSSGGSSGGDTAGSPSATRSGAPSATAGATAKAQATAGRCTVTDLRMTLGRGDPGAGNIYFPLDFTNTTAHSCTLDGFPGVSLLRGDGSVIGKPADRQPQKAGSVRLAPGQTVEADLHTLNEGVRDGGCWRKPTLIMVYPPGSKQSMTLATSNPVVCGDTFDVGPVH